MSLNLSLSACLFVCLSSLSLSNKTQKPFLLLLLFAGLGKPPRLKLYLIKFRVYFIMYGISVYFYAVLG